MANIPVVYALATAVLSTHEGSQVVVQHGTHWPADDPLVREHPEAFTTDPRYGMSWTGEPPRYMALPPDAPVETATADPGERRNVRR